MAELFAGRYLLVDVLGIGGTGAVWRAWDRKRGQYLAAKVLQQRDAGALVRFVREQSLRIEHPHVLAPNGWAAEDDQVLFTMDLMRGGSVADLLGDYGPLPVDVVGMLLVQLAQGLTAVHAAGIVHRDLKPANLLLEPTGRAPLHLRLSDFGIAIMRGEPRLTQQQYLIGTPGYFAPEQLRGAAPDPRQDLYGLGVVGCQLLSGQPPPADSWDARTAVPRGLPAPVEAVLRGLLAEDPADRYPTAEQAGAALVAAFADVSDQHSDEPTEPVEVFDHLGPLPDGFDATGPVVAGSDEDAGPGAVAPPASTITVASQRPSPAAPEPPDPPDWPSGPDEATPAGQPAPTLIGPLPTAPPMAPAKQGPPKQGPPKQAQQWRSPAGLPPRQPGKAAATRRPVKIFWAAIAAGVLAVLLAVAALLFTFGPWSPVRPAASDLQCTFINVGSTATDASGRQIVCAEDNGSYRWRLAS